MTLVDYAGIYNRLIERAMHRSLDGYVERHHVLPKCMGGTDEASNIVALTPEEHFVAHQLLAKIHPNVPGLVYALISMTGNPYGYRKNKAYGWVRRRCAKEMSQASLLRWKDPEYRQRRHLAMEKVRSDPGYSERLSKALTGRKFSEEARKNIAEAGRNRKPRKFSEEARRNMSEARKRTWEERRANGTHLEIAKKIRDARIRNGTYSFSAEHRENISKAQLGKSRKRPNSHETLKEVANG